jgi:hypothetical protein
LKKFTRKSSLKLHKERYHDEKSSDIKPQESTTCDNITDGNNIAMGVNTNELNFYMNNLYQSLFYNVNSDKKQLLDLYKVFANSNYVNFLIPLYLQNYQNNIK